MDKPTRKELLNTLADLRLRLEEAEDTLRAIRHGEVDALVVSGLEGDRIFTLKGADHTYRLLVESINEGAATLTRDGDILYANCRLAELLKVPLERVIGSSIRNYLFPFDRKLFESLLVEAQTGHSKGEVRLLPEGTSVLLSLNIMLREDSPGVIGLVVTDLSQPKRQEKLLHYITGQLVQARGKERLRIATELHDGLGHELLKVKHSLMSLDNMLGPEHAPLREAVTKILLNINGTIDNVWRLYNDLSPKDLEDMGMTAQLDHLFLLVRKNTGLKISVEQDDISDLFPTEVQIAIHRVCQEILNNIDKYCGATEVKVSIKKHGHCVEFNIEDNGHGFDPEELRTLERDDLGLGLMALDEWINILGGELQITSKKGAGTKLAFSLPFAPPERLDT
jgi:two-component system, NarL family, sensor kinase